MAYRNDFPGLLVSDARDLDQDAQNAPFGSDAGSQPTAVMPLAMLSNPATPQMTGQPLTWAQGNVAPWLGNIFNATGLSSNSVQNVAAQIASPFRDAGNWLSPGLGNSVWPQTTTGADASANPGTSTDTPYQIHNPLLDVPMQVVMPKILTDATQLNMPNVAPLPPLQNRQPYDFGDLKNADSLNTGTYTPEEAARIIQLTNIGANLSANPVKMADTDKNAVIQAAIDKKINPKYILNAVAMESGGNLNAISPTGAIGLTQIVGGTADPLKIRDRFDPSQNIQGAIDLAKENINHLNNNNLPINEENMYMMHQLGYPTGLVVIKAARDGKNISDLSDDIQTSIGKNVGNGSKTARGYIDANMQHLNDQYKVVFPDN